MYSMGSICGRMVHRGYRFSAFSYAKLMQSGRQTARQLIIFWRTCTPAILFWAYSYIEPSNFGRFGQIFWRITRPLTEALVSTQMHSLVWKANEDKITVSYIVNKQQVAQRHTFIGRPFGKTICVSEKYSKQLNEIHKLAQCGR